MADSFVVRPDGFYHIDKDPAAELIFTADLTLWLASASSLGIASATVTAETGITVSGTAGISGPYISQLITGGTSGETYEAVFQWTTSDTIPQKDERTIVIHVKSR